MAERILWLDDEAASKAAKASLIEAGINFSVVEGITPEPGFTLPTLVGAEGEYSGLDRIKGYLELVQNRPSRI